MHGLVVGHVTDVHLSYDAAQNTIVAPVQFEVEPERIVGVGAKSIFKTPAEAVAAVLKQGLRATLQSASLITGQQLVALDFVPNAPPVPVTMEGTNFVLPTTAGGGFAGSASVRHRIAQEGQRHSVQADRRQPRRHPAVGERSRRRPAAAPGADGSFRRRWRAPRPSSRIWTAA